MKAYLSLTPIGIVAFDDTKILITIKKFAADPVIVAEKILNLYDGKMVPELNELINDLLSRQFYIIITELEEIVLSLKKSNLDENLKIILEKNNPIFKKIKSEIEELILKNGDFKNSNELTIFLNKFGLKYTQEKIRRSSERKDMIVIQAIEALDDLDKNINVYVSRLREWYSLYFPELDHLVSNPETYIKIINKMGLKERFSSEELQTLGLPEKRSELIFNSIKKSIGGEFNLEDLNPIIQFSNMIGAQYETRNVLEKYIEQLMEEVAPNIKLLVGAGLGARLLSLAGGLENMSKMPASTVQVLGAEKALFTSLKSGSPPPKHGILFQHGWIHNAPKWQRGKIARALAGKLSIASRMDNFSSRINETILVSLEKRINEIKKKYPEPRPIDKKKKAIPQEREKIRYRGKKKKKNIKNRRGDRF